MGGTIFCFTLELLAFASLFACLVFHMPITKSLQIPCRTIKITSVCANILGICFPPSKISRLVPFASLSYLPCSSLSLLHNYHVSFLPSLENSFCFSLILNSCSQDSMFSSFLVYSFFWQNPSASSFL